MTDRGRVLPRFSNGLLKLGHVRHPAVGINGVPGGVGHAHAFSCPRSNVLKLQLRLGPRRSGLDQSQESKQGPPWDAHSYATPKQAHPEMQRRNGLIDPVLGDCLG
jgi:hypothetical protein